MYKLLTEENKKEVVSEYKARRTSVVLALICLLVLFLFLSVLPSFIYVKFANETARLSLSSAEKLSKSTEPTELKKWVGVLNTKLSAITPEKTSYKPEEDFKSILESKPDEVRVTGLSWQKTTTTLTLKVRGVAVSRQAALLFQSRLKSTSNWKEVNLPVEALANNTDVEFELTIIPKKI